MRAAGPDPVDELAVTIRHFFPGLGGWLDEVRDPRKSGRPAYRMRVLLLLGTLMFLGHTKSRNHMNDSVRGASAMAGNLARLAGETVADVPRLDTLEKVLRGSDPAHIERVLSLMIRRLEERPRRLYAGISFHLLLDAMYAGKGVMGMCPGNGWNFSITFKPSDMPALWDEGQRLLASSRDRRGQSYCPGTRRCASSAGSTISTTMACG